MCNYDCAHEGYHIKWIMQSLNALLEYEMLQNITKYYMARENLPFRCPVRGFIYRNTREKIVSLHTYQTKCPLFWIRSNDMKLLIERKLRKKQIIFTTFSFLTQAKRDQHWIVQFISIWCYSKNEKQIRIFFGSLLRTDFWCFCYIRKVAIFNCYYY